MWTEEIAGLLKWTVPRRLGSVLDGDLKKRKEVHEYNYDVDFSDWCS